VVRGAHGGHRWAPEVQGVAAVERQVGAGVAVGRAKPGRRERDASVT